MPVGDLAGTLESGLLSAEAAGLMLELHVSLPSGEELGTYSVVADATVLDLKRMVLQSPPLQGASPPSLRIVFENSALEDHQRLNVLGVPSGARLQAVRCLIQRAQAVLRCRPPYERDGQGRAAKPVLELDAPRGSARIVGPATEAASREVELDAVYGEESSQEDIFVGTAQSIAEDVVQGRSGLVLCYGNTGSGKTHTLFGTGHVLRRLAGGQVQDERDPDDEGLLPRSFDCIAACIEKVRNAIVVVSVSFLEILYERVYDLLVLDAGPMRECRVRRPSKSGPTYAEGLTEREVRSADAMRAALADGWMRHLRWVTQMGVSQSTLSHMIFTINVDVHELGSDGSASRRSASLRFVKLAGAERPARMVQPEGGAARRPACASFMNVVHMLARKADPGKRPTFVPWRDSRLTFLLMDHLDGSARTLLIATCSVWQDSEDDLYSTLRLAQMMRRVVGSPRACETLAKITSEEELEELRRGAWGAPAGGGGGLSAVAAVPAQG